MVGQQRASSTAEALGKLRSAEDKVIAALKSASSAFKSLSTADSARATAFHGHSEAYLNNIYEAQELVRECIQNVGTDLPFENGTMRRLVEADLAVQRTSHVHRSLVKTLQMLDEPPAPDSLSAAASPGWMPSPIASTPLVSLSGTAPSPPAAGAPITVAVPSPDTSAAVAQLSAQVALNGSIMPMSVEPEPVQEQVEAPRSSPEAGADGTDLLEL